MSKVKVDVLIKIDFNVADPLKSVVRTNAKKEAIEEILATWVLDQVGAGEDKSEAKKKLKYKIKIGLKIQTDDFYTESDTGNQGLTCGIVLTTIRLLDNIKIEALR